ncbi:APC amino acid permease [Trametes meyenii]|nr:APC amino acid permease [Trametes meyenii]
MSFTIRASNYDVPTFNRRDEAKGCSEPNDYICDASSVGSDDAALAQLGYKQEFRRAIGPVEVFGLGFSIIGLVPGISSVLVFSIPNGGPTAMIWGWTVCAVFLMFIGLALAELGSAAPTSGGLYYWTWKYASPKWRKILSWIAGYSNSIGLISGFSSINWGCAVQLMAGVSLGSDGSFVPTTGQIYGVFVGLLVLHVVLSSLATPVIARLLGVYMGLNAVLCLAIIVGLPAATPREFRNTGSYVFGGFANFYGWPNGFAFVLSFLAPLWTIGGFDAPVHISEEASNARVVVPWAIVCAVSTASVLGWVINVVVAFCMGADLDAIMDSPTGQPMATILFNSLGRKGALTVWSFVIIAQFMAASSVLTAASRQTFAFARDGALPLSRFLCRVNKRTLTPVHAVWGSAFVALLLELLAFAGPTTYSAIFSLGIAGQYTAYCIPILSRFLGGREWTPGPFTLGRFSLPVALVAVCWMVFSIIILAFPTAPGPTAGGMNYMIVVFVGWITLCLVYYYLPVYGGACWFNGPQNTLGKAPGDQAESTNSDVPGTAHIPNEKA